MTKSFGILFLFLLLTSCAHSQQEEPHLVGGRCEGCEAVLEYGDRELTAVDTLPEFKSAAKKLKLTGTIYQPDGKTPAEGVVIYIHHTNAEGIYPTRGDEEGWAKRHGYLRGWAKTGPDGKFTFYTQVPGHYPSRNTPAHIHPYVLEPDGKYYWLETYFFEGDDLLSNEHVSSSPRGGTPGVVKLKKQDDIYVINRDFILGRNIPGY
ncbi:protocatechuate 3,4-dioxygenase beta subunit [Salinimicrobium sediminis]|uniref:Protocatechuate 3,4-dioxygenase beta subunit n=1 Tax=Salinimicrobium sediminis TaxID=1343891 RepID=A0A285X3I1_9FLAO|nr:intradiol ring-cleavage dioxygenase [Salinimicrobium sediminis]SOC79875.1 protocatechuate 3,4-dioxygenase beta subunit [Salinimicrobium sediminis]